MSILRPFLSHIIRRGQLTVIAPDGTREIFGEPVQGFPDVAVRFLHVRAMRRIIMDPRLGAAEAFMDGTMQLVQGDIMELVALLRMNAPWDRGGQLKDLGPVGHAADWVKTRINSINRRGRSRANVAHHYDIGNDLYRLFLDTDMQYSCAYWPRPGMTLDEAQDAKKAHIAAKLALAPGQRILDIGCGWGGMAITLARLEQVEVLGITLSEEQLSLARERAAAAGVADRVRFELIDYRDLAVRDAGAFDRIVSVGMFEHVGARNFDTFFRAAANLMTADGVMLLHTIGRFGRPGATDAFTRKYIFPGGYIPALSETLAASEKSRLIVTDVETLRLHYALTLRQWYARTVAQRDAIVAMMGDRFFRMWTFYLAGATAAFESGGMGNYQIQFTRSRHALPLTRNYMAAAETNFSV
ncbi:MAG: cyclopropane-fatty-acyl-phospholipid synthase family protein [Sphingopyxis sp.]|uniref:cyclopropane-fatty-acyl-phospholipid synthase family protein n=1 Tax=Sphingopyxis sp. TaxID=1908224 RepID=UPI002ABB0E64|nr:cyclopropane-fatty-acyl-phospholipid synthase family protein [Sphingopyxis sp.]MDZ3833075.1 cyclopropane-fatty-acyl-phospholipid synthase family protein [Sphingopyxis sp.]